MAPWKLTDSKIKNYKHFDAVLTIKQAEQLANDPALVAKHPFFPFISYAKRWTLFAERGKKGEEKTRPIRYAARSDAYIYARYRSLLSENYEQHIKETGLDRCVLAYRKIIDPKSGAGKCNINFADEAFATVRKFENCCTIALDISSYFESIDHQLLKDRWCELFGQAKLPKDQFKVFSNITNYSDVDKLKAYERLGYFGNIPRASGKPHKGYLKPKHKVPKRLCNAEDFRNKIMGKDGRPCIIQKNAKGYGIPQGSPISDMLANIYLSKFDLMVRDYVEGLGGTYTRYSDDILVIAPIGPEKAIEVEKWIRNSIVNFGAQLKIKLRKSTILEFYMEDKKQGFRIIYDGKSKTALENQKRDELLSKGIDVGTAKALKSISEAGEMGRTGLNGLEYLGFRFDGARIFLRDSTYSNLRRKIKIKARMEARRFVRERPSLSKLQLQILFKGRKDYLLESFGKIREFEKRDLTPSDWTFWTYAARISKIIDPKISRIPHQLRSLKKTIFDEANDALLRAMK